MKNIEKYLPTYAKDITEHGNTVRFEVPQDEIVQLVSLLHNHHNLTLKLIDATDERSAGGGFAVWYIFGVPGTAVFLAPYVRVGSDGQFTSVSAVLPVAAAYERKIRTFFGLEPVGNPDARPIVLHYENWPANLHPLRKDFPFNKRPSVSNGAAYKFETVEGEGIYEIPVGPIHAGIIEPGHFRFSVAGEAIMLLEARLGYVHKGTEKLLEQLPMEQKLRLAEKISGDSSFSHSLAFCQAVEQLGSIKVPDRAQHLRVIFAELERLANHLGDIGFMMLDTGYNFGGSYGARLREIAMRLNQQMSGSRFLRGVNTFGGVTKDLDEADTKALAHSLADISKEFEDLVHIAEECDTLLDRLKTTGMLNAERAKAFGVVGVPARAVGLERDVRAEHPYAAYGELDIPSMALRTTGDVYARFHVRIQEVRDSLCILHKAVKTLPDGPIKANMSPDMVLAKNAMSTGCVEGWRGEIVHTVFTDEHGGIRRVMVRDPSFINWQVLGSCGGGQVVPDFPLINKSFNLSYTGNDL